AEDPAPRLAALHPGAAAALVDVETGALRTLPAGTRIVATSDAHALLVQGRDAVLVDAEGTATKLGPLLPLAHLQRTRLVVAIPPYVVDLGQGKLVGLFDGAPLAVGADGLVLVAARPADASRPAEGPLRWIAPSPR
ncbi:MAG: hypothetical protein FJ104_12570, partial [Deltaproteobacteria bacterium]|nr:hypothetical protein [Deltaproteobacteria bacterium]